MSEQETVARQIRIALVLYGGVSLAVYENGVTRCFYDLVRKRGVFKILLDLLSSTATVDVVTGASAGGINGLMLAAALESGREFSPLGNLWRRMGDMGRLIRKEGDADNAESLLDGEYFHEELVKCFQEVCKADPEYQSPGEMDVFVAGTDVDGHLRRYRDSLKREIDDKQHRVVFHLKHRPQRKCLGLPVAKSKANPDDQAKILGAIGRITASFPLAFPAVKGALLDENVCKALGSVSSLNKIEKRTFVDGGVLDNKPFGPALRAMFYRMPEGIVNRRLFYVEPDPVPFKDEPKPNHSPVAIGIAALTSIPGHEGIADDLDKLLEHNERIRWLNLLREEIEQREVPEDITDAPQFSPAYISTRIECLARSLIIDCDGAPSVQDYPKSKRAIKTLEAVRSRIAQRIQGEISRLDKYDVAFHLRRSFNLLYEYHHELEENPENRQANEALMCLGRIIKTLKTILDCMSGLRDQLMTPQTMDRKFLTEDQMLDAFKVFLSENAPRWAPIRSFLGSDMGTEKVATAPKDFLNSEALSQLAETLRCLTLESLQGKQVNEGNNKNGKSSILELVADKTEAIVTQCDGNARRFKKFAFIDDRLYPLMFGSGLYELDKVEFVRISPQDAQTGLSQYDPRAKVAGDELAHFSAFLRRDWRSNDILQGRFDGICQIIQSLLDDAALKQVVSHGAGASPATEVSNMRNLLPNCAESRLEAVHESWQRLAACFKTPAKPDAEIWEEETKAAADNFRTQLILAGQEDALREDLQSILTDLHFQEIKFGRCRRSGLRGATSRSSDSKIELDAGQAAREDMRDLQAAETAEKAFRELNLGSQDIAGREGQVPNCVIGEYSTLAYLMLWGMIRRSLGRKAKSFMDNARVKLFFRVPVQFVYYLFMLMRRESVLSVSIIAVLLGIIVGVGGSAYYSIHTDSGGAAQGFGGYRFLFLAILALILLMSVVINVFSYRVRRAVVGLGSAAIVVAVLALCVVYWPQWLAPLKPLAVFILNIASVGR